MRAYVCFADGFEMIEALTVVDVLRRGKVDVITVSVTGNREVTSSHKVPILTDQLFQDTDFSDATLVYLPGGLPGAQTLADFAPLKRVMENQLERGERIAAICAAPMALGKWGFLKGKKAISYPGFEKYLEGAEVTDALVVTDGLVSTGKGMGASLPMALELLKLLAGEEMAAHVAESIQYPAYFQN